MQPWGQRAQLLFYILVVLFSSQIGYDKIVHMDYIFQFLNLFLTWLIYFPRCRRLNFLKVAVFTYGITSATSNIVHSYAYLVFEKAMFQRMTSLSRGFTMIGHMAGSIIGNVLIKFWCNTENSFAKFFIKELKDEPASEWKKTIDESFYRHVKMSMKHLKRHQLLWYGLTFIISLAAVVVSGIVAWLFPKPEKEVQKGSNLVEIIKSAKQLKKRRVMFWALSWSITFMIMLYGKSWSSNLWKHHQNRLQKSAENGLYDAVAYTFGFIGSFIPAYVVRMGDHSAIAIQLIVIACSTVLCLAQAVNYDTMQLYYWMHAAFTCLLYYSLTYQNSELAKSIEHSKIKMVFNILSFFVFITQNIMNSFIDGIALTPPKSIQVRYMIMAFALGMTFLIVFVGFAGNVSGDMDEEEDLEIEGEAEAEKKASQLKLESQPEEQKQKEL